jgi:hypothetical protein
MKRLLAFLIVASFGPGLMAQTYFGPNYIHKNSASNCFGDYTILDGSVVGSTATDHLIFTHLWGPDIPHENYMLQNHGLWYTGTEWSIFNETEANIDTGLAFNVLNPKTNGTSFTHTVTVANSSGNWSDIDNPVLNNNASAIFFITKTWDNGVYDTAHVGIWYDAFTSKWAVYNEDATNPLQINSTYNIFIPDAGTSFFKSTSTSTLYFTELDDPLLNGNPGARIFIVHDFTSNSATQGYIDDELGVWYSGYYWTIYNENPAHALFMGATFNVLVIRENPVGVANIAGDEAKIKVVPNPVKDKVAVLLNSSFSKTLKEIRVCSMDGQTVLHNVYNGNTGNEIVFDLSSLSRGLYLLTAVSEEGTLSTKVNVVK